MKKVAPYQNVNALKTWFNEAINEVNSKFLPVLRKTSFKFFLHIKGLVNFHIEIPKLDDWLGDKMNESEKRMFRIFAFWVFCATSVSILTGLIKLYIKLQNLN